MLQYIPRIGRYSIWPRGRFESRDGDIAQSQSPTDRVRRPSPISCHYSLLLPKQGHSPGNQDKTRLHDAPVSIRYPMKSGRSSSMVLFPLSSAVVCGCDNIITVELFNMPLNWCFPVTSYGTMDLFTRARKVRSKIIVKVHHPF